MATTLAQGTRLGPYEVHSLLGAGGMGEVYRARDERLGREVAVKVLPGALSDDPERLRRFEHEARAMGQLNHPNIVAIYDIGTAAGTPYIVTELLEGRNLREVVNQGPLPPRRAVDIAVQIATGLAAAHARGFAHRDLKPENVFLVAEGHVKILDFGLAKFFRPASAQAAQDLTGSIQASLTMTGTIMGTASYMAPEQIREQPTDHRADIFSLGCILHEMLAGHRAFEGETPMDRMTAILHSDPPQLPAGVEDALPGIGRVVRAALEKRAADRFDSARDMAFALGLVTERTAPAAGSPGEAAAASAAHEVQAATLRRLTYREGTIYSARFAPDGQSAYYGAAWEGRPAELFWAHSGNPESRTLGYPQGDILSIAPTGEMAVSLRRQSRGGFIRSGMLARMPLGGGAPRELLDDVQRADWSPDGRQHAVVREVGGMTRIEYPVGKVLYETPGWVGAMRVSPDGKRIAFLDHPWRGNDAGSAAVVNLQGQVTILSGGWSSAQGLAWAPGGREVWFTAFRTEATRTLYAVTLDGALRPVFQTAGHLNLQDISHQGHVLVIHGNERMRMQCQGPQEERPRDLTWLDWSLVRDLSPDGKTIVFDETGTGGGELHSVYLRGTDGSPAVKLGDGVNPRLSPDGRWVLTALEGTPSRVLLLPTGAGETRIVPTGKLHAHNATWFPDGRRICIVGNEGSGGLRLHEVEIETGAYRAFSEEGVGAADVQVAPDGKCVAARGPDLGFHLYPVDGSAPRHLASVARDDRPIGWNADGSALFVFERGILPTRVFRIDVATGERRQYREISPSDPTGVDGITVVRMTPDESTYAYSYPQALGALYVIEGLR